MPSEAKSASGTRSALLTNQSPEAIASYRTAESTYPPEFVYGSFNRSGLRKKVGRKLRSKAIKNSNKTGRRSKALLYPKTIKIKIPVFLTAVATADASHGASSPHDVHVVEVDDNDALTNPSHSPSGQKSSFNSSLVALMKMK